MYLCQDVVECGWLPAQSHQRCTLDLGEIGRDKEGNRGRKGDDEKKYILEVSEE